jgi:hypothetical protein
MDERDEYEDHPHHEIAPGVGWVAIRAAELEHAAGQLAVDLIGTDRSSPFAMGQSWLALRDGRRALIRARVAELAATGDDGIGMDAAFYAHLQERLRVADERMTQRNNVVLALWSIPEPDGSRDATTIKRSRDPVSGVWDLPRLLALRDALRLSTVDFGHARELMFDARELRGKASH